MDSRSSIGDSYACCSVFLLAGFNVRTTSPLTTSSIRSSGRALLAEPLTRYSEVAAVSLPPAPGSGPPGTMVLGLREGTYGDVESRLMTEFADRVSRTVQATGQFERNRAATVALQSTLHPPALPVLPGIRLSAIYRPSAGPVEVGGAGLVTGRAAVEQHPGFQTPQVRLLQTV